ncbi:MAG: hypothetical protein D6812_02130 [Deltaproteobacteria bacterium]|nr:MAG: hypothetical protein D6812_02130 [Deltaproteobacteria bacterium]
MSLNRLLPNVDLSLPQGRQQLNETLDLLAQTTGSLRSKVSLLEKSAPVSSTKFSTFPLAATTTPHNDTQDSYYYMDMPGVPCFSRNDQVGYPTTSSKNAKYLNPLTHQYEFASGPNWGSPVNNVGESEFRMLVRLPDTFKEWGPNAIEVSYELNCVGLDPVRPDVPIYLRVDPLTEGASTVEVSRTHTADASGNVGTGYPTQIRITREDLLGTGSFFRPGGLIQISLEQRSRQSPTMNSGFFLLGLVTLDWR